MLNQIWKNVVGDMFPYASEGEKVVVTIPRGSSKRIYDFGQLLEKVENAVGAPVVIHAELNEERLLQFTVEMKKSCSNNLQEQVSDTPSASQDAPASDSSELENIASAENSESSVEPPVSVASRRGRKKKES